MKVYLIGYSYDDSTIGGGFDVVSIASTIENAKIMLQYIKNNILDEKDKIKYEIREWEVDIIDPIAEVKNDEIEYCGCKIETNTIIPYKVIEQIDLKNNIKS